MPATFTIDTVAESDLTVEYSQSRRVRTGIIANLTVAGGSTNSYALEQAYAIVAATHPLGQPYKASDGTTVTGLLLTQIQIKPLAATVFRAYLVYDNQLGLTPSTYVIEDGASASTFQTNKIPGTGEPLKISWTDLADANNKAIEDLLTFNIFLPVRTVRITALLYGRPPKNNQDAVGKVNDRLWYGRDKGNWLMREYAITKSRYQGYYQVQATAMARPLGMDWSETGILKNSITGKYVPVDNADTAALLTPPYDYGIISTGTRADSGILRFGPYDVTNFATIFGFTDPPT